MLAELQWGSIGDSTDSHLAELSTPRDRRFVYSLCGKKGVYQPDVKKRHCEACSKRRDRIKKTHEKNQQDRMIIDVPRGSMS